MSGLLVRQLGRHLMGFCEVCQVDVRSFGDYVPLAELVAAEAEHATIHQPEIDYAALYEGLPEVEG